MESAIKTPFDGGLARLAPGLRSREESCLMRIGLMRTIVLKITHTIKSQIIKINCDVCAKGVYTALCSDCLSIEPVFISACRHKAEGLGQVQRIHIDGKAHPFWGLALQILSLIHI